MYMYIHVLTVRVIVGTGIMVQVVDYGTVPAARPQVLTAKRTGFVRFAAVATLALGALAAVVVVGQTRPGILRNPHPSCSVWTCWVPTCRFWRSRVLSGGGWREPQSI